MTNATAPTTKSPSTCQVQNGLVETLDSPLSNAHRPIETLAIPRVSKWGFSLWGIRGNWITAATKVSTEKGTITKKSQRQDRSSRISPDTVGPMIGEKLKASPMIPMIVPFFLGSA